MPLRKPHKNFDMRDLREIVVAAVLSAVFTILIQEMIKRFL